jgi:hypothetical protein
MPLLFSRSRSASSNRPCRTRPRLRVRSFAAHDPAATTTSADSCRLTGGLPAVGVGRIDFPRPTPRQASPDKTSDLPRTPTASALRPLDGIGLRRALPARPDRPAFYAQRAVPQAPCVPRVAFRLRLPSHPASRRRSCPWLVVGCHQPPTGDFHPQPTGHAGRTRCAPGAAGLAGRPPTRRGRTASP